MSDGLWAPERRALSAGLVLTVTLVAAESLAVATVMPLVSRDLGGLEWYGWVFSAFFLANLGTGGALVALVAGDGTGSGATAVGVAAAFAAGALVGALGLALSGRLVARSRGQGVASLR